MNTLVFDLSGRRFGRWTVLRRSLARGKRPVRWECLCDCGVVRAVQASQLRSGGSLSCGCLAHEASAARHLRHGLSHSPTYRSWVSMWQRCTNPKLHNYSYYGGRGIRVCQRWELFDNFLADMGERPDGKSIDRINVNGNYEPGNCRWATRSEQSSNQRPRRSRKTIEREEKIDEARRAARRTA